MTKPFRGRYGFDAAGQRGINLEAPIDDTDFANKIWTEEQIAAQSRLQGTYTPDSDGEQTPDPDLDSLVPNVDVLTADYWVCDLSGRPSTGPFAVVDLNADDRIVATVSSGGVATATLGVVNPAGLIANTVYRFDPTDVAYTGDGRSLGMLVFTDGAGNVIAHSVNNAGYNYQVGEVINGVIPNNFVNAVDVISAPVLGTFQLLPNTTYYDALITGGTGTGVAANFRTGATGAEIANEYVIARGVGYTAGDVLTVEIEGQTIGTWTVQTVYSGTDVACPVTIDAVNLLTGWDLIRGAGLTRAQADRDYLRLDGGNNPSRDISWNNQRLTDLANPLEPQDAVNLRTLNSSSTRLYAVYNEIGHTWVSGQAVVYNAITDTLLLADSSNAATLADGVIEVIDVDSYYVITKGLARIGVHGFALGAELYLDPAVPGGLTETRPISGFIQTVARVRSLTQLEILSQASIFTGF